MDNPGSSRQRLPLDFSQSGYGSNTPHGPASSSSTQYRRASCEFEHDIPITISNFYQRGSATVSYTSTRAAPPWTESGEGTTPRDTYNPLADFSQRSCSQRMPSRPRLEKGVSKSLDLGLNPGPSSTLSRRQSLDDTLDLTTRSHLYDPFKTDTDEKMPIQYSQMGQNFVNIENTSGIGCRATVLPCSTRDRYSTSLSACMYPQTHHSSTTGPIPFKFRRNVQQQQSNVAQVLEYGDNCQYTYTKMKTEPQDQSYPHVHVPDYHVPRSHQQLSINTADIPGGSGLSTECSTYDALYRQASRSEFNQGQSFDTRRKARTYHRLLATPSRDDPEDSASTMG